MEKLGPAVEVTGNVISVLALAVIAIVRFSPTVTSSCSIGSWPTGLLVLCWAVSKLQGKLDSQTGKKKTAESDIKTQHATSIYRPLHPILDSNIPFPLEALPSDAASCLWGAPCMHVHSWTSSKHDTDGLGRSFYRRLA